jgi:hypothetical protein
MKRNSKQKRCAYCGMTDISLTKEHVIPRMLYPLSKANSRVQRLTIPACEKCNHGWSDDEAHFRNILMLSGEPNQVVTELFNSSVIRGLNEKDGKRRVADLWKIMIPEQTETGERHRIYPALDKRFLRILRKIVRGLYFYNFGTHISDEKVSVDILRFSIPPEIIEITPILHQEEDIFKYQVFEFDNFDDIPMQSVWLITFFENKRFIAHIGKSNL